MVIEEKAYAKINLFLDVLDKRADGFHGIRSVMHAVDLYDEVTLDFTPAEYACVTLQAEGMRPWATRCKTWRIWRRSALWKKRILPPRCS